MFFSPPSNAGAAGSAMQGIMQGLQQGQNMRQQDERMDMLQQKFDFQVEDRESGQLMQHLSQMERIKNAGGNMNEYLPTVNKFLEGSTNFNDSSFSQANFKDYQNPDGTYKTEFLNDYASNTGKDFVPGSTDAASYNNNRLMFNDEDGARDFDFDTFGAGSSVYGKHRKDQQQLDMLNDAKVSKALGVKKKASDARRLAVLKNMDNPTQTDKDEQKALEIKMKTDVSDATNSMFSDKSKDTLKQLNAGEVVSDEDVSDLMQAQLAAKQTFTKRNEKADKVTLATNLARTNKELKEELSKDSNTGMAQSIKANLLKTVGSKDFKEMDETAQRETLMKGIRNSKAMARIFEIIKLESGAAFTDEEFAKRMSTMVGGDLDKVNNQTLLSVLGSFTDGKIKDVRTDLSNISSAYSGDKAELTQRFNKGTKDFGLTDYVTPGGTKNPKPLVKETQRQITELKGIGSDILEGALGTASETGVWTDTKNVAGDVWNWAKNLVTSDPEKATKTPSANPYLSEEFTLESLRNRDKTGLSDVEKKLMVQAASIKMAAAKGQTWALDIIKNRGK